MPSDKFKEKNKQKLVEDVEEGLETAPLTIDQNVKTGKVIARHYEILEAIGQGGMSTVYKARHTILNKVVAIKFILPRLVHDQNSILRFKKEAQAATELQHPNICSVKEFGVDEEGSPYIVMDYVEGKSLREEVDESGPLLAERALHLFKQICTGVQHAHSRGVIHRDIKPDNIVLVKEKDGQDGVRIVDFGIAKL
ncbi:MAG: serine/threonine protein kinase, partial [Candidatus Obscuribacterales bacterium]|nr:serine/threonine protein kinase [Candidatus Obscuribacterales bacterium]